MSAIHKSSNPPTMPAAADPGDQFTTALSREGCTGFGGRSFTCRRPGRSNCSPSSMILIGGNALGPCARFLDRVSQFGLTGRTRSECGPVGGRCPPRSQLPATRCTASKGPAVPCARSAEAVCTALGARVPRVWEWARAIDGAPDTTWPSPLRMKCAKQLLREGEQSATQRGGKYDKHAYRHKHREADRVHGCRRGQALWGQG